MFKLNAPGIHLMKKIYVPMIAPKFDMKEASRFEDLNKNKKL